MTDPKAIGDVAIIGMSCRVAGANSPSELWHLLASSRDVQSEITRFNIHGYYHAEGGPRKGLTNVKHAYMLDDDIVDRFDHAFFHVTPIEAVAMDPQQRMLLEIAYEAVENAGIPLQDFMSTDTAVYSGSEGADYASVLARDIDATPKYAATGTATCMTANRLSYFFNLSGPSVSVDTACSSTMAALNQAVRTLQCDEASMALVCGGKLIFNPDMFPTSSELGFLSPSGRSRCFDAAGDGYGRGEGVLAILLKPLNEALAGRDPIRAVIKGTQLNQDGRTRGITLPSATAQKNNMQKLYSKLNISPNDIQYIEAHGTGTAAGDPLEISAINSVFGNLCRNERLVVGSIKSNIGHLEACSALASVIKVVECLEREQIPPQMHLTHLNPKINFQHIRIPLEMVQWPRPSTGVRRAAINTFGAGGTNGHAVLEACPHIISVTSLTGKTLLFKVSAANIDACRRLSLRYADYIEATNPNLDDLAYTLLSRRSTLKHSLFLTASTHEALVQKLRDETLRPYVRGTEDEKKAVFLFTGQGAQWPRMGKYLIDQSPLFRAVLFESERSLAMLPDAPSWSIVEELSKDGDDTNIYQSAYSQPLCTALQVGLVILWRSWGLYPTAVVGHSSGEIAAAFAAGLISLRDAIVTAYYRGLHLSNGSPNSTASQPRGGMCVVGMSEKDAMKIVDNSEGRVQLAAVNAPTSCTLSGDADIIKEIVKSLSHSSTFCRELRVDLAYHSYHMLPAASRYEKALRDAEISQSLSVGTCDMFSSVTGQKIASAQSLLPLYWKQNMVSTVRFSAALVACITSNPEISMVVEVGPHTALKSPSLETLRSAGVEGVKYFNSCIRGNNDLECLLTSAGGMIAEGVPLKTANLNAREEVDGLHCTHILGNILTNLPSYQWDHSTSFWAESKVSRNIRHREFPRHQLLGSRYLEDIPSRPSWRSLLMLTEVPWLMQLKTDGASFMPSAAFILMAYEAARRLQIKAEPTALSVHLHDITFWQSLPLASFANAETVVELHLIARQIDDTCQYQFDVFSESADREEHSKKHCSGTLTWALPATKKSIAIEKPLRHEPRLLKNSKLHGHNFHSKLGLSKIGLGGACGTFDASLDESEHNQGYPISPLILDAILQLPPISLLGSNLPAQHRVIFVKSISAPASIEKLFSGQFTIQTEPEHPYRGQSNIEICFDGQCMSISELKFQADNPINHNPALETLFSSPVALPDISRLKADRGESMSLRRCLELCTHKWPMSDIGVIGVSDEDAARILGHLQGIRPGERSRFRSIEIVRNKGQATSERVRVVEMCSMDANFQIIFASDLNAQEIDRLLHTNGLICLKAIAKCEQRILAKSFDAVCTITGFVQEKWALWRRIDTPKAILHRNAIIFTCPDQDVSSIDCLPSTETVCLTPTAMDSFCRRDQANAYDAVIVDCKEKSIILTWSGEHLVPWLQHLVRSCNNILWISQRSSETPYNKVAGNLLRTLQSEQPSINVTWLILEHDVSPCAKQDEITSAYTALLRGENEVELDVSDSNVHILRYLPDDDLSAATGLSPPRSTTSSLAGKDYKLSVAAPQVPVMLTFNPSREPSPRNGNLQVIVEASVVDADDLMLLNGMDRHSTRSDLGFFFSGRVISSDSREHPSGSRVVGWHDGAHRNRLYVNPSRVQLCNGELSSAVNAVNFAVLATALCVVDGAARAREGDCIQLDVDGILKEVISRLCVQYGVTVLEKEVDRSPDFTVSLGLSEGLRVNGLPIDTQPYLDSEQGRQVMVRAWKAREELKTPVRSLPLQNVKQGLHIPLECAFSTVIIHTDVEEVQNTIAIYKEPRNLLSEEGAYVIIGGLGGLGRYVCTWMIAHGAKNLVVVSRSGLNSIEAQETFASINASGAIIKAMKANACDQKAISDTFHRIRERQAIKGVINMAMLLGDAPLADMTGEQWDRALRLKVDSSWILHEETLGDDLELFIMFSSIASVLGNRNQAGYNVGNTFLNSLATYRRSLGLTAISIALGAMTEIGILHELGKDDLLQTLTRAGLSPLGKAELNKIMEAAVIESHRSERSMILTGLEMFERVDGRLVGTIDQQQLYWTELPEFGFLQSHTRSCGDENSKSKLNLRERIQAISEREAKACLLESFFGFLSELLGFPTSTFDAKSSLATYGLDSLSAVSCQYWFHKELSIRMYICEIFDASSIDGLMTLSYSKLLSKGPELGATGGQGIILLPN